MGRDGAAAEVFGVRGGRQQPGYDLLRPAPSWPRSPPPPPSAHAGHGQGQRHDRAGPVLTGRAVHQRAPGRVRDGAQGGDHRVRPVDEVREVDRRDALSEVDLRARGPPRAGPAQAAPRGVRLVSPRRPRAPLPEQRELVPAYAGPEQRPGPSAGARSRCAGRRHRSGPGPSSWSISAGVSVCRLSERSSRPGTILPPSVVGRPPTSRRLARPTRSIHIRCTRPS